MSAQGESRTAFAEIIAPLSMAALRTLLHQRKPCHVVGHARLRARLYAAMKMTQR